MSVDRAIHSGFLIYWTGKDLESKYHPDWRNGDKSKVDEACKDEYLQRLHDILFGFWLTAEAEVIVQGGPKPITIPSTPKLGFTELKLSESRVHAGRYGRLGIGVKRPYLFQRCGRRGVSALVERIPPELHSHAGLFSAHGTRPNRHLCRLPEMLALGENRAAGCGVVPRTAPAEDGEPDPRCNLDRSAKTPAHMIGTHC